MQFNDKVLYKGMLCIVISFPFTGCIQIKTPNGKFILTNKNQLTKPGFRER